MSANARGSVCLPEAHDAGHEAPPRPPAPGAGLRRARRIERENLPGAWEFYRDADGRWRWRCLTSDGKIAAASTSGFSHRYVCEANAFRRGWNGKDAPPDPFGRASRAPADEVPRLPRTLR